jgi:hypothetical protein
MQMTYQEYMLKTSRLAELRARATSLATALEQAGYPIAADDLKNIAADLDADCTALYSKWARDRYVPPSEKKVDQP